MKGRDCMKSSKQLMISRDIKGRGIKHPLILRAFEKVDREAFVPSAYRPYAYHDGPLPIKCGQTISQPYMMARMIDACQPKENERVLEIGTGSGYQTALLSYIYDAVVSVEYSETLFKQAKEKLKAFDTLTLLHGDGKKGAPAYAPFDAIIVAAAHKEIPPALKEQLTDNGRLVMPVGGRNFQELTLLKKDNTQYKTTILEYVRFVPLI